MRRGALLLLALLALLALLVEPSVRPAVGQEASLTRVRVGVYPGPPIATVTAEGRHEGIYVDLLREVAQREQWALEFVSGTWAEGLQRLDRAEIDLMVGVGFSEERAQRFAFSSEPVLSNWGQVYVPRGSDVQSILDLAEREIAVMREDIYYQALSDRMQSFGIQGRFVELDTREAILGAVARGDVAAGLVSRLTAPAQVARFDVQPSSIVCCPIELRVAAPLGQSAELLAAVDGYLREARADRESAFHRSLDHWLDSHEPIEVLPSWLLTTLLILLAAAAAGFAGVVTFRRQLGQRTEELRQRDTQLRQAQKLEAVGRLAAGIAHDFNNQLTIIKGYGDLLLRSMELTDRTRSHLTHIQNATSSAARMTDSLLTFARRQLLQPEVVDLPRLVDELSGPLSRMIGDEVQLTVSSAADIALVETDPVQVQQALLNLTVNARDAMPSGGEIRVELSMLDVDPALAARHDVVAGPYVVLAVTDSGEGMSLEVQSRLFEPFFTTKPTGKGTGLGLAMVHGFAAQSGGFVTVESAPGEGACISVHLPSASDDLCLLAPTTDGGGTRRDSAAAAGSVVLVVEDEPAVRQLLVAFLERNGHKAIESSDVHNALALAEAHAAELTLLVTDVIMPDMLGPEVARRVREVAPELPTLFITGHSDMTPGTESGVGPSAVLKKPFVSAQLDDAVAGLLSAAPPQSASNSPGG